ncbi:MAG: hypothetical protein AAGF23_15515 [Acidobacteriota bacterium]
MGTEDKDGAPKATGPLVDYRWLRDRDDPRVVALIEQETADARAYLRATAALEADIVQEIQGRFVPSEESTPVPWGPYSYFSRREEGRDHLIHGRRARHGGAVEEVVLDENEIAHGRAHASVRAYEVSPDHSHLAYVVDFSGGERLELFVRNLGDGSVVQVADDVGEALAWAADSRTLFYSSLDSALRPHRIYRCRLGSKRPHVCVHEEVDGAFRLELAASESGEYLFLDADVGPL